MTCSAHGSSSFPQGSLLDFTASPLRYFCFRSWSWNNYVELIGLQGLCPTSYPAAPHSQPSNLPQPSAPGCKHLLESPKSWPANQGGSQGLSLLPQIKKKKDQISSHCLPSAEICAVLPSVRRSHRVSFGCAACPSARSGQGCCWDPKSCPELPRGPWLFPAPCST